MIEITKEELKKLNSDIMDINNAMAKLDKQRLILKISKKKVRDKLLRSKIPDLTEINKIEKLLKKNIPDKDMINQLNIKTFELYKKGFHGIISQRVRTDIVIEGNNKRLWINSRGLATLPNWCERTRCWESYEFDRIVKQIKDHPELRGYLKSDPKREIMDIFHKCFKDWFILSSDNSDIISTRYDTVYPVDDSNYSDGIHKIIPQHNKYFRINLNNENITVTFCENKDFYHWHSKSISLNGERLSDTQRYMLSQLEPKYIKLIKDLIVKRKAAYDCNLKLFIQLREDITSYILARVL